LSTCTERQQLKKNTVQYTYMQFHSEIVWCLGRSVWHNRQIFTLSRFMYITHLQEILRHWLSKSQVFWNTTRCQLVHSYLRFKGSQCLTHLGLLVSCRWKHYHSCEVRNFVTVDIAEDLNVQQYGCDNLIAWLTRLTCRFKKMFRMYAFFWVIPRRLNFRRRGITQKKAHNIRNTAEVWNQDVFRMFKSNIYRRNWRNILK
jgi:hypothetical protein